MTETWHPSVDGVVTRLVATVDRLDRLGHSSLVIAPAGRTDATDARTVSMPSIGLPFLAGGKPWGVPLTNRVTESVRRFRPDIVHVLNPFILGIAGVRAARRLRLPLVASFHQDIAAVAGHYHVGFLGPAIWAHVRRQHSYAALNLATSQAMADEMAAHGIANLGLWSYGVDTERFRPRPRPHAGPAPAPVTALYVGRLAPEKDFERLAPLAGAPGVRLVVVGDGPLRSRFERSLAAPNVEFRGWLAGDTLAQVYSEADVFVFPSTTETLGLVLLEALASGLPVVAAGSAPSAEVLGDWDCGVLVDDAAWGDLATVVRRVGQRDDLWQQRSRLARARTREWDWASATDNLVDQYERLLDGHGGVAEMAESG
ncbi:MAG: glycosyltransferase family 4 protein [Acidimicrobiales bacterium]